MIKEVSAYHLFSFIPNDLVNIRSIDATTKLLLKLDVRIKLRTHHAKPNLHTISLISYYLLGYINGSFVCLLRTLHHMAQLLVGLHLLVVLRLPYP